AKSQTKRTWSWLITVPCKCLRAPCAQIWVARVTAWLRVPFPAARTLPSGSVKSSHGQRLARRRLELDLRNDEQVGQRCRHAAEHPVLGLRRADDETRVQ